MSNTLIKSIYACAFLAQAFLLHAQPFPPVTIPGAEVRTLESAITHQNYRLFISCPGCTSAEVKTRPVLYLLDAQWDFPLMYSIYGEQYYDGYVPQYILVGVTWGPSDNPDILRRRDFTPTVENGNSVGGGADAFLEFFEKELFPFIEKEYKGDPEDRALAGCSLGGLFTLYALYNRPELFKRYISASPAIGWDDFVLLESLSRYETHAPTGQKFVFVGHGTEEANGGRFKELRDRMLARKPDNVSLRMEMLPGVGHSGTKAIGYTWGVQHVYREPLYVLSREQLIHYSGIYKDALGRLFELRLINGTLELHGLSNVFALRATSATELKYEGSFLNVRIDPVDSGDIHTIHVAVYGDEWACNRIGG